MKRTDSLVSLFRHRSNYTIFMCGVTAMLNSIVRNTYFSLVSPVEEYTCECTPLLQLNSFYISYLSLGNKVTFGLDRCEIIETPVAIRSCTRSTALIDHE